MQLSSKYALLSLCLGACVGSIAAACGAAKYTKAIALEGEFDKVSLNTMTNVHVISGGSEKPVIVLYSDSALDQVRPDSRLRA